MLINKSDRELINFFKLWKLYVLFIDLIKYIVIEIILIYFISISEG